MAGIARRRDRGDGHFKTATWTGTDLGHGASTDGAVPESISQESRTPSSWQLRECLREGAVECLREEAVECLREGE